MTDPTPPHNLEAEESLLGAMLVSHDAIEAAQECSPSDFYRPGHGHIFKAITTLHGRGQAVDPVTVSAELASSGLLDAVGDASVLISLQVAVPSPRNARDYARLVIENSERRVLQRAALEMLDAVDNGKEADAIRECAQAAIEASCMSAGRELETRQTREIFESARSKKSKWLIPGLLKEEWRALIVGFEGHGKSTLLRQIAMCAAAGIHPFTYQRITPVVSLVLDLENEDDIIEETAARIDDQIRAAVGDRYNPDALSWLTRPKGTDLRSRDGQSWLDYHLGALKPQLLVAGPLYKLSSRKRGEDFESETNDVQHILDKLRERHHFALILETHAPQGDKGGREARPYGSSFWLRWSELGIGLEPAGDGTKDLKLSYFRESRSSYARWPDKLLRGRDWPWVGYYEDGNQGDA